MIKTNRKSETSRLLRAYYLLFLGTWFLLGANVGFLYGQDLTLRQAQEKAQQVNPRLQSLVQVVKAKRGAVRQADVGLNPSIGINAGNRVQTATFVQELEYPGKRHTRMSAARAEVEVAEAQRGVAALQIQEEAARLFYEILWGSRNVELLRQNLEVNDRFLQAARHKFEQGFGSELDVIKGQVEVVRARRLLRRAQQAVVASRNKLKTLLKIPLSHDLTLQGDLNGPGIGVIADPDSVIEQAVRSHPAMQLRQAEVEAAGFRVEMARLAAKPNFAIDFEGGLEDKEAKATVGVSLPLALWDKKKGARMEAVATQESRRYRLENTRDQIVQKVTTAYQEYQTALATVKLFDQTLLNKAKEAAEAAQQAFVTRGFRFLDLIDAQRTYLDTMLEYNRSLLSLRLAEVDLHIAAGQSIIRE
ncbi:TolC family protein [Candidatus Parcubacteria bacterium]|nr:MAG: TolC family protein [Candidatus Parcubacteria bacterium]